MSFPKKKQNNYWWCSKHVAGIVSYSYKPLRCSPGNMPLPSLFWCRDRASNSAKMCQSWNVMRIMNCYYLVSTFLNRPFSCAANFCITKQKWSRFFYSVCREQKGQLWWLCCPVMQTQRLVFSIVRTETPQISRNNVNSSSLSSLSFFSFLFFLSFSFFLYCCYCYLRTAVKVLALLLTNRTMKSRRQHMWNQRSNDGLFEYLQKKLSNLFCNTFRLHLFAVKCSIFYMPGFWTDLKLLALSDRSMC